VEAFDAYTVQPPGYPKGKATSWLSTMGNKQFHNESHFEPVKELSATGIDEPGLCGG
jgi:hypothetical protein